MAKDRSSDTWGKVKYQAHMAGLRLANALRDLGIRLPPRAQLVYHPDYVLPVKTASARHAFDTHRGGRVVERMREVGVLGEGMLLTPEPISAQELELVHAPEYLADISRPERLAELLFVSFDALAGQDPMRSFLLQAGGTLLAAREALEGGGPVFNLGGGFHHAQRDRAEGLCPINDVAVAIRALQQQGKLRRALVVDLDYHQGNGTALIFGDDERVFTLSVHGQSWSQVEQKENTLDVELSAGVTDGPYLEAVARSLDDALGRFEPELAIYLAGVDVHRRDDLGDFAISEKGLLDRDLMVLERLDQAGVPVAVTLAGGYWPMAWSAAYNMIYSSLTGVRIHRSQRPSNIRGYFRRRRRELDPALLSAGAPELTEETLEDLLVHKGGSGLFLDFYSADGLQLALEHYGFLDLLRERGFSDLQFAIDTDDPQRQVLRIHGGPPSPDNLLTELVARYRTLISSPEAVEEGADESYRTVSIEWLLMQNPRASFTLDRRRLPGQAHPGLGVGRWMVELLRLMAERLDCTGLMNIPRHYHNAYLYSKQMLCFEPDDQGYLEAMKRDLNRMPLVETSEAVDDGRLRLVGGDGEPVYWEGKAQVMPVKPTLNRYFVRPGYIEAVARARERYRFEII